MPNPSSLHQPSLSPCISTPSPPFSHSQVGAPQGFQSRSLKAAFFLKQAGYTRLSYLTGGLQKYVREGLPLEAVGEEAT